MKVTVLLTASLALSVAGSTSTPEKLRLVPNEGLVLKKTFEMVSEDVSEETSWGWPNTYTTSSERTLVVTDEIQDVKDGRITKLSRTFNEISANDEVSVEFDGSRQDFSIPASCEVEDSTVVFEWDEDDENYVATSEEVGDDILADLVFDYDFTALLPDDEVDEGDEWAVDTEAFKVFVDPWDSLPLGRDFPDGRAIEGGSYDQGEPEVNEQEEGEIVATFVGTREVDGVTMATISIAGEIRTDLTTDRTSETKQGPLTLHVESSETHSVEGEALWDLKAGRLHSVDIEVSAYMIEAFHRTDSTKGGELDREWNSEGEGTATFSVSIAVVK